MILSVHDGTRLVLLRVCYEEMKAQGYNLLVVIYSIDMVLVAAFELPEFTFLETNEY